MMLFTIGRLTLPELSLLVATVVGVFLWLAARRSPYGHLFGPPPTSWLFGSGREAMDFSIWSQDGGFGEPGLMWLKRYGSVYYYRVLHMHRIVVADPVAIKHVMVTHGRNYPRAPITRIISKKLAGGESLLSTEGRSHTALRKLFNPHFGQASVKTMLGIFQHHTNVFMEQLTAKEPVDLQNLFTKMTLDVIGVAAFGFDFQSLLDKNAREIQAYNDIHLTPSFFGIIGFVFLPFYEYLPLASNRHRAEAQAVLQGVIDRVLQQKVAALNSAKARDAPKDILDLILEQASDMSMADIRAMLLMFMIAGHETTDNTLGWIVSFVAQHPEVAANVHEECSRMRGDGNNTVPTWDDLSKLPYLSAVIHESMRLRPTVPELPSRLALEADMVPLTDGSHLAVPKGANIFLDIIAIQRNPTYWSRPNEFLPERFIEGTNTYEADLALRGGKPNTFCYFPFGLGDKRCIGNRFSMTEMLVVLSAFFAKYRVALTSAADVNVRKHTGTIAPVHLEVHLASIATK
ncbi:hypothetical protein SDRG_09912 [Saprolegnia diclina VS20]|uniref:Cytochrome P450 n=1 Tax=Saprolegnia diclina (strain VS20) TaxID=1156394 RepID=T0QG65_SAPDV|nr:hypothetical protein SDRG_09912 [Saprolegnia diclina VS20]EQC32595.1 hypothetical protein SDRG_09912 [Saprolegnia diclina VS20]|eukprot:XP_008614096.1 hypothetical protein SDRG_09912 [Saprolegnia diclina VS20]